jgi:uncharacterized membrane protein
VSEGPVEYDERAVDRLALFSDAVAAIAITLLAIDLPVPAGNTVSAFWASVQRNDGHYAAFLLSFAVIAVMWGNHHNIFRYLKRADGRLRAINTVWLLAIILNPFATKLLTSSGPETLDTESLQSGFYALVQVLESAAVLAMLQHIISHQQAPDAPRTALTDTAWRSGSVLLAFGLSIPVFFATHYAWVLWIVGLLFGQLFGQLRQLRHRGRAIPEDEPSRPAGR